MKFQVDELARGIEFQLPVQRTADAGLSPLPWWLFFTVIVALSFAAGVQVVPYLEFGGALLGVLIFIPIAIGLRGSSRVANAILALTLLLIWGVFFFFVWQYSRAWQTFFLVFESKTWSAFITIGLFWSFAFLWVSVVYFRSILTSFRLPKKLLSCAPANINKTSIPIFFSLPRHFLVLKYWRKILVMLATGISAGYLAMFLGLLTEGYDNPRELLQQSLGHPDCRNQDVLERLLCGKQFFENFDTELLRLGGIQIVVILIGINVPAYIAKRVSRVGFHLVLEKTNEPPILFLRPFEVDRTRLASGYKTVSAYVFNFGQFLARTFESLIVDELQLIGPVIAIGDPGNRSLEQGALKEYYGGDDWKDAVAEQINNARLVVTIFDDRESIWWELKKISELDATRKTVIVFWQEPDPETISRIANVLKISELPEMVDFKRLLCWYPEKKISTIANERNFLTYSAALRVVTREFS